MQQSEHVDFTELVQFHALRENPTVLTVESCGSRRGWIWLEGGRVVRAKTAGGKSSIDAFVEIMAWDEPTITKLRESRTEAPDIAVPLPQLLMEAFWRIDDYVPDDPHQEGLEEDTITHTCEVEAPDGVTSGVLGLARQLRALEGSLGLVLLSTEGREIERLGVADFDVPNSVRTAVRGLRRRHARQTSFSYRDHIDILLPPIAESDIVFLVRIDRTRTNRGRIEVALRRIMSAAA